MKSISYIRFLWGDVTAGPWTYFKMVVPYFLEKLANQFTRTSSLQSMSFQFIEVTYQSLQKGIDRCSIGSIALRRVCLNMGLAGHGIWGPPQKNLNTPWKKLFPFEFCWGTWLMEHGLLGLLGLLQSTPWQVDNWWQVGVVCQVLAPRLHASTLALYMMGWPEHWGRCCYSDSKMFPASSGLHSSYPGYVHPKKETTIHFILKTLLHPARQVDHWPRFEDHFFSGEF